MAIDSQQFIGSKDVEPKGFKLSQLRGIKVNSALCLTPIDADSLFNPDNMDLISLCTFYDDKISAYLPTLDFSTPESAQKCIIRTIKQTEAGLSFAYAARIGRGLVGVIYVNTPMLNSKIKFPYWTIDFFLLEPHRGKQLMPRFLLGMSFYLREVLKLKQYFIVVDETNTTCIRMLDNCLFITKRPDMSFVDPNIGKKAVAFQCNLHSEKFTKY